MSFVPALLNWPRAPSQGRLKITKKGSHQVKWPPNESLLCWTNPEHLPQVLDSCFLLEIPKKGRNWCWGSRTWCMFEGVVGSSWAISFRICILSVFRLCLHNQLDRSPFSDGCLNSPKPKRQDTDDKGLQNEWYSALSKNCEHVWRL